MNFFNFSLKKTILTVFLIFIPLLLITVDRQAIEKNFLFQSALFVTSHMQSTYYKLTSPITQAAHTYLNLLQTRKTSHHLRQENKKLKSRLQLFEEMKAENHRLRSTLQFAQKSRFQLLAAQVVGRDPISEYHLVTINRGHRAGVRKNMMVINEKGFVGYVFRVQKKLSQVILLTDPSAAVHALISHSRIHGIVEGSGKNHCWLKYIKRRDPVQVGDKIVTAHQKGLSLKGFPIGLVSQVKKNPYGLSQQIKIKPFIQTSELEEVFVVQKTL